MANSGRAEAALDYYYRALELNPGYIRARYVFFSCFEFKTLIQYAGLTWEFRVSIFG